jgi:hypothetical protein
MGATFGTPSRCPEGQWTSVFFLDLVLDFARFAKSIISIGEPKLRREK